MPQAEFPGGVARLALTVTGQVQGVGFRPFVYRIALEQRLSGSVQNTPAGVRIELQGAPPDLETFARRLEAELPPLAAIVALQREPLPPEPGEREFRILHSSAGEGHAVLISPDTATCADCLGELQDPRDRRHRYPFTNCTNCGPRYTITRAIPYDRATTSMACFPLCPDCAAEYGDPLNRRFHAQPNACPVCGPQVWLVEPGAPDSSLAAASLRGLAALQALAQALVRGRVAAIKGLGGFHLACAAWAGAGEAAVAALRERKHRPHKPLALMLPDLVTARRLAVVDATAALLLEGRERPIVLCPLRPEAVPDLLAPEVAPDTREVGLMLPYTPLHAVLFACLAEVLATQPHGGAVVPALVMTSGNGSGEPICLGNREALQRLGAIADLFLLHNRDILIRTDDSVLRPLPRTEADPDQVPEAQFLRRARGYTPRPVFLPPVVAGRQAPSVLGLGPELKSTLCLTKGDQAFVSQHIGDLENLETLGFFREIAVHLQDILQVRPQALVRDLHPDYLSSRYAMEQSELPVLQLQHHYAHIHAVLAEHRHVGPVLGLALDGTGLGDDGTLWGGELLFVNTATLEQQRLGRFCPMPLPGGERAIREPWRLARGCLWLLGKEEPGQRPWPWLEAFGAQSAMLPQLLEKRINSPLSSSCGRLFDAVAALLGLAQSVSYEGQAAIRLEQRQHRGAEEPYACAWREEPGTGLLELGGLELFGQVLADWEAGLAVERISRRFHLGLVRGVAAWVAEAARRTGLRQVALSGGVLQNRTLCLELPRALAAQGLTPLCHKELPPNDGCISLGQAAWGRLHLR